MVFLMHNNAGHPPGKITPQYARVAMGNAYFMDGATLYIGKYL